MKTPVILDVGTGIDDALFIHTADAGGLLGLFAATLDSKATP